MPDIFIRKTNEVYVEIYSADHIAMELRDHFTFKVPGYQFMPSYRMRVWSGDIHLFSIKTRQIYYGLIPHIEIFAKDRNYSIEYDTELDIAATEFSLVEAQEFIDALKLPFEVRDYQIKAFVSLIRNKRRLLLSPTASGKSLIIYMIARFFEDKKILILTPTTSLVSQLMGDFKDYSKNNKWKVDDHVHYIMAGREKDDGDKGAYISTWQSLYKLPKEYFEKFDVVIGDECLHGSSMISMGDNTKKRIDEIKIGDIIKTYNELTHAIENKLVNHVYINNSKNEKLFKISLNSGNKIKITGNHKVLLKSGEWKRVDHLKVGDIINSIE